MLQRGIETFLAVAKFRTLRAAAAKLHLAQSTVSKRLQQLEEECGITFFDRGKGGKNVVLTPAGERFYEVAERMMLIFYEVKNFTPEHDMLSVVIGAVTSIHNVIMPRLCARIAENEPLFQFTARTLHSDEMYDEIDRRSIDIGFSFIERAHHNVKVEECFSEPMFGIKFTSEKQDQKPVDVTTLDPQKELCFPWSPAYQIWHYQWFPGGAFRVNVDDLTLMFCLLQQPGTWAIVPSSVADFFQKKAAFTIFELQQVPPERVCFKLTHKYPRPRAKEAVTIFERYLDIELQQMFSKFTYTQHPLISC